MPASLRIPRPMADFPRRDGRELEVLIFVRRCFCLIPWTILSIAIRTGAFPPKAPVQNHKFTNEGLTLL